MVFCLTVDLQPQPVNFTVWNNAWKCEINPQSWEWKQESHHQLQYNDVWSNGYDAQKRNTSSSLHCASNEKWTSSYSAAHKSARQSIATLKCVNQFEWLGTGASYANTVWHRQQSNRHTSPNDLKKTMTWWGTMPFPRDPETMNISLLHESIFQITHMTHNMFLLRDVAPVVTVQFPYYLACEVFKF